jgi:serine/threonine protein kinase
MLLMQTVLDDKEYSAQDLKAMIAQHVAPERMPRKLKIVTDTSDFFRVDYDDVLMLAGQPYLIRNYEREGRFGISEQPKFWVKRAIDLTSGSKKIIKMEFPETFTARVGDMTFECSRSSKKEARILDLVRGHPAFMQGYSTRDAAGNIVRVIDYIHGTKLDTLISEARTGHENYFFNIFPSVLDHFITLVKAIAFLHSHGEKHGDIRRDHIIKDTHGSFRWIDFDYNYLHREHMFGYDLFGLGNILIFLTGKGDITLQMLKEQQSGISDTLSADDMNIIFGNRVVNLKKIYPYIPEPLNMILLHFSPAANTFYEDTEQFLLDLEEARGLLPALHNERADSAQRNPLLTK